LVLVYARVIRLLRDFSMRKLIVFLLVSALIAPTAAAQQKARDKAKSNAKQSAEQKSEEVLRRAEETQRISQAVDVLKGVVESVADIQEMRTRMAVLTGALDLLWKHDEPYARASFIKSAAALSDRFASEATQKNERSEIRASMGTLLMAFSENR
jgi:hypothetical protein